MNLHGQDDDAMMNSGRWLSRKLTSRYGSDMAMGESGGPGMLWLTPRQTSAKLARSSSRVSTCHGFGVPRTILRVRSRSLYASLAHGGCGNVLD